MVLTFRRGKFGQRRDIFPPESNFLVLMNLLVQPGSHRSNRFWTNPGTAYIPVPGLRNHKQGIDMAEIQVGQIAPSVELPTDNGSHLNLRELAGKPVVLYFYPQDDTETCTAEAIEFSRLKPDFSKAGAIVVGISPDSIKKHGKFRTKYKLTVDLAADEKRAAIEAYGGWVEKLMFGRKYMGVERSTFLIGPDGKIAKIWRKVRVKGHAEAVLAAVLAL
jgi:peroxiredoxin Q/BCP